MQRCSSLRCIYAGLLRQDTIIPRLYFRPSNIRRYAKIAQQEDDAKPFSDQKSPGASEQISSPLDSRERSASLDAEALLSPIVKSDHSTQEIVITKFEVGSTRNEWSKLQLSLDQLAYKISSRVTARKKRPTKSKSTLRARWAPPQRLPDPRSFYGLQAPSSNVEDLLLSSALDVVLNNTEESIVIDDEVKGDMALTEVWLTLKDFHKLDNEEEQEFSLSSYSGVGSDSGWATSEERQQHIDTFSRALDVDLHLGLINASELVKDLLGRGHAVVEIAERWRSRLNRKSFRTVIQWLLEKKLYRLAFRVYEAALSNLNNTPKFRSFLSESTTAWFMVTFMHKLNEARTGQSGISISESSWAPRIENLAYLHVKHNLVRGSLGPHLKDITTTATPEQVLLLHKDLQRFKLKLSEDALHALLCRLARNGDFTAAFAIYHDLEQRILKNKSGRKYKQRAMMTRMLMYSLYRAGVHIHSSDLLEIILSTRSEVDPILYHIFLYSAAKAGDSTTAMALLEDIETVTGTRANLFTYTSIFNMYKRLQNHVAMKDIHMRAIRLNLKPFEDLVFVNSFLDAQSKSGHYPYNLLYAEYCRFFVREPLDRVGLPPGRLPESSMVSTTLFEPDPATLTIMLHSFLTDKDHFEERRYMCWPIYQSIVKELETPSAHPMIRNLTEDTLSLFIHSLGKNNYQLPYALNIVEEMNRSPYLPDPGLDTWNSLLWGFTRHGDLESARKIWKVIQKHKFKPDTFTYNAMMLVYSKNGMSYEAGRYYAKMRKNGFDANRFTEHTIERVEDEDKFYKGYREELNAELNQATAELDEHEELAEDDEIASKIPDEKYIEVTSSW